MRKAERSNNMIRIAVGEGSCGIAAGAAKVYSKLESRLTGDENIKLGITGCIGMCFLEPIVDVYADGKLLRLVKVGEDDAERIADAALAGDFSSVSDLEISDDDAAFLTKQTRIALRNCGIIDPTDINSYIERDGYKAITSILKEGKTPEEVIETIKVSGLAGRGGAGFPT